MTTALIAELVIARARLEAEKSQLERALVNATYEFTCAERLANFGRWRWNIQTGVQSWTGGAFAVLGLPPGAGPIPPPRARRYITRPTWGSLSAAIELCAATGCPFQNEAEVLRPDGTRGWILVSGEAAMGTDGTPVSLSGTVQDIDTRKRMEVELLDAKEYAENIVETVREPLLVLSADLHVIKANRCFYETFRATPEDTIGHFIYDLGNSQWDIPELRRLLGQILPKASVFNGYEVEHDFPDIGRKTMMLNAREINQRDAGSTIILLALEDITERKRMDQELRLMAYFDPLTKLANRRLLHDRLSQAMVSGNRSGCYGALMSLDLDNFKSLNDHHGHMAGDLLLIEVARRLKSCIREIDTVARVGGDEFVVLLRDLTEDQAPAVSRAGMVAEKVRALLATTYVVQLAMDDGTLPHTVEHHCTASIGVVMFLGAQSLAEEVFKRADATLYQAKAAGRNRVLFSVVTDALQADSTGSPAPPQPTA